MAKATSSTNKKSAAKKGAITPPAQKAHTAPQDKKSTNLFIGKLRTDLSAGALFAELAGTFTLTAVLLVTGANAIIAAIAVLIAVMVFSRVSGGHVNPVVTLALLALRKMPAMRAAAYITAQVVGAMIAFMVIAQFTQTAPPVMTPNQFTGEMMEAPAPEIYATSELVGEWRPFFAEALGAIVFGLAIAAVALTRREGLEAGYMIGGALLIGLLLASQGSAGILNPAAAIGLQAYTTDNWWTVGVYAIAPLIGGVLGAVMFRLFHKDAAKTLEKA